MRDGRDPAVRRCARVATKQEQEIDLAGMGVDSVYRPLQGTLRVVRTLSTDVSKRPVMLERNDVCTYLSSYDEACYVV